MIWVMVPIRQKPVLIFGNSTDDTSMAVYAETGNKYQTSICFLLCDDTVRENGNIKKAKRMVLTMVSAIASHLICF